VALTFLGPQHPAKESPVGISIFDAVGLAKQNKAVHEELTNCCAKLQERFANETAAQESVRRSCQETALAPLKDILSRIKNVDLAQLTSFDDLPAGALPDAEVQNVRLSATSALKALVGGAASGAALGAATFTAVGALATASTGAAIAGLSGAAATSATLAAIGGGAIAAGGGGVALGTTILTGLVAAPVLLACAGFVEFKGRQQRRQQQETQVAMRRAAADLTAAEAKAKLVITRGQQIRSALRLIRRELVERLPALELLIADNDNYATYTNAERRQLAESVTLATTLITVMSTMFIDDKGMVTDLSKSVIDDAKLRLRTLQAA
jgi:hypothetical protein